MKLIPNDRTREHTCASGPRTGTRWHGRSNSRLPRFPVKPGRLQGPFGHVPFHQLEIPQAGSNVTDHHQLKTGNTLEFNSCVKTGNEEATTQKSKRLLRNPSPSIPGRPCERGRKVTECPLIACIVVANTNVPMFFTCE